MYEQTMSENWLDELDGAEDDALRVSLQDGQRSFIDRERKIGSTGSDVVVSGKYMLYVRQSYAHLHVVNGIGVTTLCVPLHIHMVGVQASTVAPVLAPDFTQWYSISGKV